jgi:DNA polymerase-3 subunit beta
MKKSKNGNGKPWLISVDRDDLVQALALVGSAINRRSTIPILQHVLCHVEAKILTLTGTDLDVRVRHRVKCEAKDGEFTLPWHGLGKALSALTRGSIVIEVLAKDKVAIFDRTTTLQYESLPPADFPVELSNKAKATSACVVGAGELSALIDNVRHAISDDQSRYYLNGAYFHCVEMGVLRVVTTDGHRMVIDQIKAENLIVDSPKIIVPTATLKAILKHCDEAPSAAVEIASHTTGVSFDFGLGRVIESKVIDGTFPDYNRVIPEKNDKVVLLDTNELDAALAKFPAGAKRQAMGGVKLTFKKNNLTLSREAKNGNPGIRLSVRCEWQGPDFSIGFNPAYLRDAISVLGDTVGIAFGDPGTPALLMSEEYPQITLMPMRA